jgi:hypothetical protein
MLRILLVGVSEWYKRSDLSSKRPKLSLPLRRQVAKAQRLTHRSEDVVGEQDRTNNTDDQQDVDQRRAPRGQDIVVDEVGQAAHMLGFMAEAARIVGVKIPMPYVPRSCRNQGTEARIVARGER